MPRPPIRRSFLLGLLSALAFCGAFAAGATGRHLPDYLNGWRGWDDLAIASTYFRDGSFPVAPYEIGNRYRRRSPEFRAFRRPIMKEFKDRPVAEAWATADATELLGQRAFPVAQVGDPGRAFFLGALFRLTGAIRPLFLLWFPVLLVAATVGWAVFEISLQRRVVASVVVAILIALSAFFREASAIGYAAYGSCFAAGFALIAFSVAMSSRPSLSGAWPRLVAVTLVLSLAVPARASAWLMAPAFVAVWALGGCGIGSWKKRLGACGLGLVAMFLAPLLIAVSLDRASSPHRIEKPSDRAGAEALGGPGPWPYLWLGLGDFDREKGHRFLDEAAREVARAGGFDDMMDPGTGTYFRGIILEEIASDPSWFAGILLRRMRAAFLLEKLWPSADVTGKSFAPSVHPNEGAFDAYMELAPTVDQFGWSAWAFEAPGFMLPLGWLVLAIALGGSSLHGGLPGAARTLVPPLAGLMATPVFASTGSAIDLQAVAAVHFVAWALALDAVCGRLVSWRAVRIKERAAIPA